MRSWFKSIALSLEAISLHLAVIAEELMMWRKEREWEQTKRDQHNRW